MFGFFKRKSYTGHSDETQDAKGRLRFIRRLVRERMEADPVASLALKMDGIEIDKLPDMAITSTPDSSTVRIVERYIKARDLGIPDGEAIELVHADLASVLMVAGSPFDFPPLPMPMDLRGYCKFHVDVQHQHGAPLTRSYIDYVILETYRFYNRTDVPPNRPPFPHDEEE